MVTTSYDLPLRGQRSTKVKIETILNGKNNSVDVLYMDRDTKVSMVTFSYDLLRRVKGQRRSKFLTILNVKNNSQHVEHGQVCRSVHGGLF